MSPGNDQHENDSAKAGDEVAANHQKDSNQSLTLIGALFQPPQSPSPQNPSPEQPQKWYKDRKFVLELLGFAVLFAYTIFSCLQWLQIRWTNRMTREGLNDNSSSLIQTLTKMQGQIDATNELYGEAQKQTKKFGILDKNSGTEADATKAQLALDEHPWLGIVSINLTENPKIRNASEHRPLKLVVAMDVKNWGQYPAQRVYIAAEAITGFVHRDFSGSSACKTAEKWSAAPSIQADIILPGEEQSGMRPHMAVDEPYDIVFGDAQPPGKVGPNYVDICIAFQNRIGLINHIRYLYEVSEEGGNIKTELKNTEVSPKQQ